MTSAPSTPRIALVTGSTNGLGHAVARRLMADGTTVILHGPTPASVDAARERLGLAGLDLTRLETEVADFTRLSDVAALADRVAARHPVLDVLVNNAAVAPTDTRTLTEDDHELAHQVNYLAPYLLTRLLWDPLGAARPGRVVNASSALHRTANLNWGDLDRVRGYARIGAYAQSKLALTMFTRAAAVAAGGRILAVSVHPGILSTGMLSLYARVGQPVADGADVVARLCRPETTVRNGAYYDGESEAPVAPLAADDKAIARLWKATAKVVGLDRQPASV
ncbi:MAG TPA: SDR family NAD(P)-dependent oxidoreductase [Actinocrinis sp.]|uniref:SDR family NAD(P)-dependent oxidoreductase n=1 Tax=Actinocrinis sp. TaxID=1920516 RepID=UPI002DDD8031|nr:SDR family NAD(P)-dependent oxidoreductase [Actinocrinis sp.]HEV3173468.1 SDR family NAD(P)-dependent oxidoreductase [Actinocrinis sp.]